MCRNSQAGLLSAVALLALVVLVVQDSAATPKAWEYINNPAFKELNWACYEGTPSGIVVDDPGHGAQSVRHEHVNWHCNQPDVWGTLFFGPHRQLLLNYDVFRDDTDERRIEGWEPKGGAVIPGANETTTTPFGCSSLGESCESAGGCRVAGATCSACYALPDAFRFPTIATYSDLDDLGSPGGGFSDWFEAFQSGVASAGCLDISEAWTAPRDPVFWMTQKTVSAIAREWARYQPTDFVVVIDRSNSMSGDKIKDARETAKMFAGLIANDMGHKIGLVAFGTAAGTRLALTAVEDQDSFDSAVDGIHATGGNTNFEAGIDEAIDVLGDGSNAYQAIVVLTDGKENRGDVNNTWPTLVSKSIPVCAVGIGDGVKAEKMKTLATETGGLYRAKEDESLLTMQKYFIEMFGQLSDEAMAVDPLETIPAGQTATTAFTTDAAGPDTRLTFVLGIDNDFLSTDICPDSLETNALKLIVKTPAGNLVDVSDPALEVGSGRYWRFVRIPLPYRGEDEGTWTARAVRPQNVFVNGFTTDAFVDPAEGVALVREQIHRLLPEGGQDVLYYEDGSVTGSSVYREALDEEEAAGTIASVVEAPSEAEFGLDLAGGWDLIVFARQMDPTAKSFDTALGDKLCAGQRAIITDLYHPSPAAGVLLCAGATPDGNDGWNELYSDGHMFSGMIELTNPGYPTHTYGIDPVPGATISQALSETLANGVIGTIGCSVGKNILFTSLARGLGRVEAAPLRDKYLVGDNIEATFRMTAPNRPSDDWDAVDASVKMDRPSGLPLTYQLYDDGTNGDRLAGNNYWTREIPVAATVDGPYQFTADFHLTKDGETIERQAHYTVLVVPDTTDCAGVVVPPRQGALPSASVDLGTICVRHRCAGSGTYSVLVTDSAGWLCTEDESGTPVPLPFAEFFTPEISHGDGAFCFYDLALEGLDPLFICVPPDAVPGDSTEVVVAVDPVDPNQPAVSDTTVVYVTTSSVTSTPDLVPTQDVLLTSRSTNPTGDKALFQLHLPSPGEVRAAVFSIDGRKVQTLMNARQPEGTITLEWDGRASDGSQVPSGVYSLQVQAGGKTLHRKIVRVR
jgi:uncharacterized protein YegL